MLINGLIEEDEDDYKDMGAVEFSDDEEEVVTASMAEKSQRDEENKEEFDEYMRGEVHENELRGDETLDTSPRHRPLRPLDLKLQDISERCKQLLIGVRDGETLNLFEELVNESNALLAAMETEIETEVAADSGAVDHAAGPDDIPGCVEVRKTRTRNFVGPTGKPIEHHGEALVHLVNETGKVIGSTFQIANVVRPLHSVSKICDEKHDMLFTATGATVVPAGTLSKFLASLKGSVTYQRKGGLYVTKVKVKAPGTSATSSFIRPGVSR